MNFLRNLWNWTVGKLTETRGDIGQMFTPPKSKSPWEAMTQGSTGGWAGWAGNRNPTNPNDPKGWGFVGPLLTTAMGAIPGVGPLLSAGMGAMGAAGAGGFQGTDSGWGKGIMDTIGGGLLGYGLGTIGKGIGEGVGTMMSPTGSTSLGTSMAGGPTASAGSKFAYGFGQGTGSALGNTAMFSGPIGGSMGAGQGSMAAGGGFKGLLGIGGGGSATGAAGGSAAATNALSNPLQALAGMGVSAISQMGTNPKPPQVGPIASKWLTEGALTKAGKLAQDIGESEYLGDFNVPKEYQAFMQASAGEISKTYKIRRQSLDEMGQASNPGGWRSSGERLEMHRRLNEEEQRETDLMKSQWMLTAKQEHSTKQYNYVMAQMNLDEATKRDLLFAEISDVMWKYNIERDDLLNFRTIARDAGMYMLQQGIQGMMGR